MENSCLREKKKKDKETNCSKYEKAPSTILGSRCARKISSSLRKIYRLILWENLWLFSKQNDYWHPQIIGILNGWENLLPSNFNKFSKGCTSLFRQITVAEEKEWQLFPNEKKKKIQVQIYRIDVKNFVFTSGSFNIFHCIDSAFDTKIYIKKSEGNTHAPWLDSFPHLMPS